MKKYLLILASAATQLHAHAQDLNTLTLQERLQIEQIAILQEQNDHLQYITDQIRRAELRANLEAQQRARNPLQGYSWDPPR